MTKIIKKSTLFLSILLIGFVMNISTVLGASTYKDGEYSIPFTVLKGDSDEQSMTNDYLTSPGKLIVKNGKNTIEMTLKNSDWWQYFKVEQNGSFVDTKVISEDAASDTRVVQFTVDDVEQILNAKIHVIVPNINYDNKYDIRFQFDTSQVTKGDGTTGGDKTVNGTNQNDGNDNGGNATGNNNINNKASGNDANKKVEKNPATGDTAPILLLVFVIAITGFIVVRKFNFERA